MSVADDERWRGEAFAHTCLIASMIPLATSVAGMAVRGEISLEDANKLFAKMQATLVYEKPSFMREKERGTIPEHPWGRKP